MYLEESRTTYIWKGVRDGLRLTNQNRLLPAQLSGFPVRNNSRLEPTCFLDIWNRQERAAKQVEHLREKMQLTSYTYFKVFVQL
jgi:hypothetical protein